MCRFKKDVEMGREMTWKDLKKDVEGHETCNLQPATCNTI